MKKNLDLHGVGLGIGVGFVTMLVLTAVFSWLVSGEHLSREQLHLAAGGVLVAGSLLGALCCGRGEGRFLRCGIVALGLGLCLLGMNLTFFDGSLPGLLQGLLTLAGGAAAGALLTGEKKGGRRYKKYRTR